MIPSFADAGTPSVLNGLNTKAARKVCPEVLWTVARRKLDSLDDAARLDDLHVPLGNWLETLKGNRKGEYSVRISDQYRICSRCVEAGPEVVSV